MELPSRKRIYCNTKESKSRNATDFLSYGEAATKYHGLREKFTSKLFQIKPNFYIRARLSLALMLAGIMGRGVERHKKEPSILS